VRPHLAVVRVEDVGRAKLQAGQTRPWLEQLPGQERLVDPSPLPVGVRGVLVLLVGIWALTSFARGAGSAQGAGRQEEIFLPRRKGGEKEGQGILLAGGCEGGKGMVGPMDNAQEILEGVLRDAPTSGAKSAA
jgi:hypothetical protein